MSDAEIVRAGLGPWSDGWVAEHAATGAHAYEVQQQRAALDRLESQNQALQEENESLGLFVKEAHEETLALQEALKRIADDNLGEDFDNIDPDDGLFRNPVQKFARHALSPTQETDRPDIEEIGRGIARDFGKTFDILAKADRPTQETDPG